MNKVFLKIFQTHHTFSWCRSLKSLLKELLFLLVENNIKAQNMGTKCISLLPMDLEGKPVVLLDIYDFMKFYVLCLCEKY